MLASSSDKICKLADKEFFGKFLVSLAKMGSSLKNEHPTFDEETDFSLCKSNVKDYYKKKKKKKEGCAKALDVSSDIWDYGCKDASKL